MRVAVQHIKEKMRESTTIEQVMPVLLFFWTSWFSYFDTIQENPTFAGMRFFTNNLWTLIFFFMGIAGCVFIIRGHISERKYFLYFLSLFWFIWGAILSYSNYASAGFITYLTISLACYLSARRI